MDVSYRLPAELRNISPSKLKDISLEVVSSRVDGDILVVQLGIPKRKKELEIKNIVVDVDNVGVWYVQNQQGDPVARLTAVITEGNNLVIRARNYQTAPHVNFDFKVMSLAP